MTCTCGNFEKRMAAEAKAHNLREALETAQRELAQVRYRLARAGVERAGEDVEARPGHAETHMSTSDGRAT